MLDYHTGLDKLGSKIEFDNAVEQRETLDELSQYILQKYKFVYFKEIKKLFFNKYNFYHNRKTIFGIVIGCYKKKNPKASGYYLQYYINITFSGLKRYDEKLDEITKDVLYSAYAFLHTKEIQRDRDGTFEPKLVPKRERLLKGSENLILSLHAKGMSVWCLTQHHIPLLDILPPYINNYFLTYFENYIFFYISYFRRIIVISYIKLVKFSNITFYSRM